MYESNPIQYYLLPSPHSPRLLGLLGMGPFGRGGPPGRACLPAACAKFGLHAKSAGPHRTKQKPDKEMTSAWDCYHAAASATPTTYWRRLMCTTT